MVDLLTGLLPPEKITGLVIVRAEKVTSKSTEAFIVRLFRQNNSHGFIKAFTDSPEPFATGFAPLTRTLKNLFLRTPLLYPRFHVEVAESLEKYAAEVVELEVPLSPSMRDIQNAILDATESCLVELKRSLVGLGLDIEDWSVDSALHREFDKILRRQLDPLWHRISRKARQIVGDIALLRQLLGFLLTYDSVSFMKILDIILASNKSSNPIYQNQSPWLFLDSADTIFAVARSRIKVDGNHAVAEEQPKWHSLLDIIFEAESETTRFPQKNGEGSDTILIMCGDQKTCAQLAEVIRYSRSDKTEIEGRRVPRLTAKRLRNYFAWKDQFDKMKSIMTTAGSVNESKKDENEKTRDAKPMNKRRRVRGGSVAANSTATTSHSQTEIPLIAPEISALIENIDASDNDNDEDDNKQDNFLFAGIKEGEIDEEYFELLDNSDLILIHPYAGDLDDRLLEEIKPRFCIMYEPDAAFIRRIEVFRNTYVEQPLKVYFMYYKDSVEEQRYLSTLRREKDAFTKLIRERGNMAMTLRDTNEFETSQDAFLRTVNTRIAGGGTFTATSEQPRVIVDVREFRSSLPSMLHAKNMNVIPCMLTIGDYVLSPQICVERKSVKDLIQSFNSGRLYSQCEMMQQYYKTPVLLIEFDQDKSFNLGPITDMSTTIGTNDLQSKLVLLTLAFPQLKIVWASSSYVTAEMFEDLKKSQEEPDPMTAVKCGLSEGEDVNSVYNQAPIDFLRAFPGITEKNYRNVISAVGNVQEFANMSERQFVELLGPENGYTCYNFINKTT